MALQVALPVRLFVALLAPIVTTVQFVVWRLLWLLGVREGRRQGPFWTAQEEIRGAVELHHQEGRVVERGNTVT